MRALELEMIPGGREEVQSGEWNPSIIGGGIFGTHWLALRIRHRRVDPDSKGKIVNFLKFVIRIPTP